MTNFTNYSGPGWLSKTDILNPLVLDIILTLNSICTEVIGLFGIVGNIINIIVFSKQGFDDTVNITLTALAVSDLGVLVIGQFFGMMINPWFIRSGLPLVAIEVVYMTVFYPHNYFTRVCGFITAFASFERCLCVLVPLKVKTIITKQVTIYVIIFIYFILLLDLLPLYYVAYLDWVNDSANVTKLRIVFRENPYNVFGYSYFVTDLFIPNFTFVVIITCTVTIGVKLNHRSTWRKSVTQKSSSTPGEVSSKEKKVVSMLVVVSVIFVLCLTPQAIVLTTVIFIPELSILGPYVEVTLVCFSISFLMETINSTVTIIVYYTMSSRYKTVFQQVFSKNFK